jgi:hypothetical protein
MGSKYNTHLTPYLIVPLIAIESDILFFAFLNNVLSKLALCIIWLPVSQCSSPDETFLMSMEEKLEWPIR